MTNKTIPELEQEIQYLQEKCHGMVDDQQFQQRRIEILEAKLADIDNYLRSFRRD